MLAFTIALLVFADVESKHARPAPVTVTKYRDITRTVTVTKSPVTVDVPVVPRSCTQYASDLATMYKSITHFTASYGDLGNIMTDIYLRVQLRDGQTIQKDLTRLHTDDELSQDDLQTLTNATISASLDGALCDKETK